MLKLPSPDRNDKSILSLNVIKNNNNYNTKIKHCAISKLNLLK